MQLIERIKKVIFNKTQEKLFAFYQKPVISIEKIEEKDEDIKINGDEMEEYLSLYRAYSKAERKTKQHKYYKKLIEAFDDEFKQVFKNVAS